MGDTLLMVEGVLLFPPLPFLAHPLPQRSVLGFTPDQLFDALCGPPSSWLVLGLRVKIVPPALPRFLPMSPRTNTSAPLTPYLLLLF